MDFKINAVVGGVLLDLFRGKGRFDPFKVTAIGRLVKHFHTLYGVCFGTISIHFNDTRNSDRPEQFIVKLSSKQTETE